MRKELGARSDGTYLVDVGQDTTTGNGSSDQLVQLFVTSDCQLQMSRSDTLDTEIFCGVTWDGISSERCRLGDGRNGSRDIPASSRTSAVRYSIMAAT